MPVINRLPALIGEKQTRENRRISIADIAIETGVSRTTIYNWLENKIERFDAPTIAAFCKYFKCKVGDLLVYEEDPPSNNPELMH